jgi:hypothetical protein
MGRWSSSFSKRSGFRHGRICSGLTGRGVAPKRLDPCPATNKTGSPDGSLGSDRVLRNAISDAVWEALKPLWLTPLSDRHRVTLRLAYP